MDTNFEDLKESYLNYEGKNKITNEENEDGDDCNNVNEEDPSNQNDNIKEMGMPNIAKTLDPSIQVVPIIGQIEGHNVQNPQTKTTKYEHLIPMLISMERDDDVKGILTVLNTVGGDVEAGLAIAEIITSLSKPVVSLVIGGSHSIGVPLATCADYSFISPSATMIIHPIRMNGLVMGVPQTFNYFSKMQERISDFVVRTSHIQKEVFEQLMLENKELLNDMGTILVGREAVECGLIDEVGGVTDAIKKLKQLME